MWIDPRDLVMHKWRKKTQILIKRECLDLGWPRHNMPKQSNKPLDDLLTKLTIYEQYRQFDDYNIIYGIYIHMFW